MKEDQANKLLGSYWFRASWFKVFFGLVMKDKQVNILASAERSIRFGAVSVGPPGKRTRFGSARGVNDAMNICCLNSLWAEKVTFKFERPDNYNQTPKEITQDICQKRQMAVREGCNGKSSAERNNAAPKTYRKDNAVSSRKKIAAARY